MNSKMIVELRKQAEESVADMPDGPLKLKAFEVILDRLLVREDTKSSDLEGPRGAVAKHPPTKNQEEKQRKIPSSCPERILLLRDEGFFKSPRTLGEIRDELQLHGWTYPVTSLSGPLQRLAQKRELRRMPGQDANAGSYTYVAP